MGSAAILVDVHFDAVSVSIVFEKGECVGVLKVSGLRLSGRC